MCRAPDSASKSVDQSSLVLRLNSFSMAWFKKARKPIAPAKDKASRVPEGLWVKCPECSQIIYNKDLATNLRSARSARTISA